MWRDQPYTFETDVWSLGCITYELAALQLPFEAKNLQVLYKRVTKGAYKPLPPFYSSDLVKIVNATLQVQSTRRISLGKSRWRLIYRWAIEFGPNSQNYQQP